MVVFTAQEQTKHSGNQLNYQCHCSFLEVDCLLIVSFCVPDLLNNFSLVLLAQSLFLQIYNEPIMDLLDPNQKNLQVNSETAVMLFIVLVFHCFMLDLELTFCFLSRLEKMSNLVSMLKILQRSKCVRRKM